jgi:hypothetical protein
MPKAGVSPLCFSETQRNDMRRWGVIEAQIAEWEAVLPVCRAMMCGTSCSRLLRQWSRP